jgi:hypothetical protein
LLAGQLSGCAVGCPLGCRRALAFVVGMTRAT